MLNTNPLLSQIGLSWLNDLLPGLDLNLQSTFGSTESIVKVCGLDHPCADTDQVTRRIKVVALPSFLSICFLFNPLTRRLDRFMAWSAAYFLSIRRCGAIYCRCLQEWYIPLKKVIACYTNHLSGILQCLHPFSFIKSSYTQKKTKKIQKIRKNLKKSEKIWKNKKKSEKSEKMKKNPKKSK